MVLTRSCAVGLTSGGVMDIEPTEGDSVLAYYPGVRVQARPFAKLLARLAREAAEFNDSRDHTEQSSNPASRKNVRELLSRMDIARAHAQGFVLGL